jgi:hypothetical protein
MHWVMGGNNEDLYYWILSKLNNDNSSNHSTYSKIVMWQVPMCSAHINI